MSGYILYDLFILKMFMIRLILIMDYCYIVWDHYKFAGNQVFYKAHNSYQKLNPQTVISCIKYQTSHS